MVLTTSKACLRVKTGFTGWDYNWVQVRVRVRIMGLVGMVEVRASRWVIHHAGESPSKPTRTCVSVCCVLWQEEEAHE